MNAAPTSAFLQNCQQRYLRSFTASTSGQAGSEPRHAQRRAVTADAGNTFPLQAGGLSSQTPFSGVPLHNNTAHSCRPTARRYEAPPVLLMVSWTVQPYQSPLPQALPTS